MFAGDQYEMKKHHKNMLTQHRLYLLHNLRPGEEMLSSLLGKGVLSPEMVEEIKVNGTANQQVSALLNMLPARGPSAFDDFCDTLLECDHPHVAEYLKTVEATEQFREDIKRQMEMTDVSDSMLEKFVSVFKRTTPAMQRFHERKFEVMIEEQESDMRDQETELEEVTSKNTKLQLEADQLRDVVKSCVETSNNIATEVQEPAPSKHYLKEEVAQLEKLKRQVADCNGNEQVCTFYSNLAIIVRYITQHTDTIIQHKHKTRREKSCIMLDRGNPMSLIDKVLNLSASIDRYIQDISGYSEISREELSQELKKVCSYTQLLANDVTDIKANFSHLYRQRKKTNSDILSLLHNFQEIRRLEREVKEKKTHITDLNKHGQMMRKKACRRKELEQIQTNLNQQKMQLDIVQKALESQTNSADQRLHQMCELLPDLEETDSNADSLSFTCSSPYTDDMRSLSGSLPRRKMNGDPYLLASPRTSPSPAIAMDFSSPAEIHPKPKTSARAPSLERLDKSRILQKSNVINKPLDEVRRSSIIGSIDKKQKVEEKVSPPRKEDTEDKPEAANKVGQPYKSKVYIPKDRNNRNVISNRRLPMKPPEKAPMLQTATSVSTENKSKVNTTDLSSRSEASGEKPQPDSKPANTDSVLKLPAKRQHENSSGSSSGSESQPGSADITSRKRPTEDSNTSTTNTSKPSHTKPMTEQSTETTPSKTSKPEPDTRKSQDFNPHVVLASRLDIDTSVTRPMGRKPRVITQTTSNRPPPTGLSREEYFAYIRQQQQGQAAELHSGPMVIGRLHKAANRFGQTRELEIPSMSMPTAKRPTPAMHSFISREDSTSDANRKPGHRQALSTKRVEPAFKLPNQR